MKKIAVYILSLFAIIIYSSCEKDPFVPKDVIQHLRDSIASANSIQNICFIYNNDVYFLDNINNSAQKITNTPLNTKTEIRISHNLQKIAYLNSSGNPEIIDRSGTILSTLTTYSGIRQMDWSNDDATLYMLIGNQLYYYGPAISCPTLTLMSIPLGSSPQVLSATLSKNNDLAYVVQYYDFSAGTLEKLIIKKNDGTNTETVIDNPYYPTAMLYAKFSVNATDLVVGYNYSTTAKYYTIIDVYSNLQSYPDMTIPFGSDCVSWCPTYRSDKKCLLSAYSSNISSGTPTFVLSAYYMKDLSFNNKTGYNNATSDLIVDWK